MKKLLSILGVTGVVVGTGSFAIAYSINKSSSVKEQVKPEGLTYKTSPQELDLNKDFNLDLYAETEDSFESERILKLFLNDDFNKKKLDKLKLSEKDFIVNNQNSKKENPSKDVWTIELKGRKNVKNNKAKLNVINTEEYNKYKSELDLIFKLQRDAFGTFHSKHDVLKQLLVYAKDKDLLGLKTFVLANGEKEEETLKDSSNGQVSNLLKFRFFNKDIELKLHKVMKDKVETKYLHNDQGWKITQIGYKLSGNSIVLDIAKYKNITEVPKHLPLKVNSLEKAFHKVESRYITNLDKWNTSNITSLLSAFDSAKDFNQDISTWDTSNVTNMQSTFFEAKNFNKPLDRWKVHNVTSMDNMFSGAESFNQSLNSWKTSNVQDMNKMFWSAKKFDGDITKWDVKKVKTMSFMFAEAESFNKNISLWNVENVETMYGMFSGAKKFKHNLKKWNAKSVTNIQDFRGRRESGNYVDWFREDNIPTFNQEILKTFK
ncbi:BspA family leucine-rich repeat surface protein [Mycoplasma putrefaciens]|uniref:PARCEL domain protein n=1 Tax=Mycoplasma putrefaciens (strain ATCC 15718 / NCTC 10155 / C30 KS-1 / KS-1) TaxID=743965 RepID=A0A7U4E997_MYCPK|nr:BspA family leucine-rich repeat surface protein [Mycoplasma putrefaciens]AEM68622.1 PARCEL domain protein [Mycoplasma putrefaciens KS1]